MIDPYYGLAQRHIFEDVGMVVLGSAVEEVSDSFDSFWKDPFAVPLATIDPVEPPEEIQRDTEAFLVPTRTPQVSADLESGLTAGFLGDI